jgi:hypothetical protein
LATITTGNNSTAVGRLALTTNSTGANLTAVGAEALKLTTVGNNTAVGAAALFTNSSGQYNVAVGQHDATGYPTLYSNSIGSQNTAIGSAALCSNTTASYGTAVGYQAGYSSQTADYNTFIGYRAGFSTTGDQNTFLGKFAGNAITSGATNTIVGAYNGNQASLDIRTASNYTVISDGGGTPHLAAYAGGTVALQGAIPNAGTGITFPATQSASSNANTLDDYEEGTWTPAVLSGGVGITVSTASYTKIGRMVYLQFDVTIATNSSSQALAFSGLPFVANSNRFSGLSIGYNTSGTAMAVLVGGTNLEFYLATSATSATNSQASGARFIVGGCFQT